MGNGSVVITALGMATSLGLGADVACAAARAGLCRSRDIEGHLIFSEKENAMVPVLGHPVGHRTEGFTGVGRLARLGSMALADLWRRAGLTPAEWARTGLFVAAPSGYLWNMADALDAQIDPPPVDHDDSPFAAERRDAVTTRLVPKLFELCRLDPPRGPAEVLLDDQAGFAAAVARALHLLGKGAVDRCVVGGVDSYLEKETLGVLARLDLLQTPDNTWGTIPGEGAAFLLLESAKAAARRQKTPLCSISPAALATSEDHQFSDVPPTGRALSEAVEQAAGALPDQGRGVGLLIGTQNGLPWTAAEWSRAEVRLPRTLAAARHWRPAESFGETGAAAGAIAACLGATALSKGYARTQAVVVWMSSGRGTKGAVGLQERAG